MQPALSAKTRECFSGKAALPLAQASQPGAAQRSPAAGAPHGRPPILAAAPILRGPNRAARGAEAGGMSITGCPRLAGSQRRRPRGTWL